MVIREVSKQMMSGIYQIRNVIKMKSILTDDDDRCRLNVFNRVGMVKCIQIMNMWGKGYSKKHISKSLGYSRDYIGLIIDNGRVKYDDVNSFRGSVEVNKHKKVR